MLIGVRFTAGNRHRDGLSALRQRAKDRDRGTSRDAARHVATQLSQGVGRDRLALGGAQAVKAFGGLLQLGIEAADAKPDQRCFHSVDDPTLLADEARV
ncbi:MULTISPECIES: hypothetical protein, partial [unclassified Bradyrhizobium]|uniref:hypothetical protein n=1 Tax=unclassified Bradyrhizobium TaxID=2631580 RepID=UPI001FF7BD0A